MLFYNEKWLELLQLFILVERILTIIEDEPLLVVADGENRMILADSIVVHEHYSQVGVRCPGLMKCCILGERVVFTVTRVLGESCKS